MMRKLIGENATSRAFRKRMDEYFFFGRVSSTLNADDLCSDVNRFNEDYKYEMLESESFRTYLPLSR